MTIRELLIEIGVDVKALEIGLAKVGAKLKTLVLYLNFLQWENHEKKFKEIGKKGLRGK